MSVFLYYPIRGSKEEERRKKSAANARVAERVSAVAAGTINDDGRC